MDIVNGYIAAYCLIYGHVALDKSNISCTRNKQCPINQGANGAAAPGPRHGGGTPHEVLKSQFVWLSA